MATITSAGSGDWNTGGTWVGGIAPTSADDAIIANTHTVTLSGSCAAQSITVNTGGTLTCSTTVSTTLTIQRGLTQQTGSNVTLDVSSNVAVTCTVILNNVRAAAASNYFWDATGTATVILKGFPKKRWTTLTADMAVSATTCTVADATGWQTGDKLVFGTTQAYNATPRVDASTGTNTVSGASISNITATTYAHASGGLVGNFSSNLVIRPNTAGDSTAVRLTQSNSTRTGYTRTVTDVEFSGLRSVNDFPGNGVTFRATFTGADGTGLVTPYTRVGGNAFWDCRLGMILTTLNTPIPRDNNIFYMPNAATTQAYCVEATGTYCGDDTNSVVFRNSLASGFFVQNMPGMKLTGCIATACAGAGLVAANEQQLANCESYSNATGIQLGSGGTYGSNCLIGTQFGGAATNSNALSATGIPKAYLTDSYIQTSGTLISGLSTATPGALVDFVNRSADVTVQERYLRDGNIKRDNSVKTRGTSSLAIQPTALASNIQRTQSIACAAGATIRVVGYVRMDTSFWNAGDNNLPTVVLSGLGATAVTHTATSAANNAWEKFDISITNTSGADGNFTLTYTANAKTVSTGTVYFDGVPDSPFITKVRHYGFLFSETSPTREVNPYTVASEATAAAYTGVTINAGTKRVTFGIGTADTLAKVYDYSQAWAVANIDKEVPWQRAGALLSLTSGWAVVDPVISGVTWGGGVIEWNTPGAISGSFDSTTFRFNAAGTYDLSGGTFAGTINLTNTSGGGVIVIVLPSGIDYVNDDPGSITVEVAVESATASITNIVPGSRLQVFNVTENTEMFNGIVAGTSWSDSYPNGTGYSTGDVVRVRLAWHSGAAAKLPVQYQTIAASGGWAVLADQQDDEIYNLNGIDGDTVAEFAADYPNVQIDVDDPDGFTTPMRGYAWYISGQLTADGIRFYHGGMTAIDAANYRINVDVTDMHIQNARAGSSVLVGEARLYRSDGSRVTVPGIGGATIEMEYGAARQVETGVSGLTSTESDKLMSLSTENLDATVSSRLAAASYAAPANADIATIKSEVQSKLDAAVSTRMSASSYVAPANADVAAIKAVTDTLPTGISDLAVAVAGVPATTAAAVDALELDANVVKIKGQAINGSGSEADPWGP